MIRLLLLYSLCGIPCSAVQAQIEPITLEQHPDAGSFSASQWPPSALRLAGAQPDSLQALKYLFPGRFYENYGDYQLAPVMVWCCKDCPKKALALEMFDNAPETDTFPNAWANFTEYIGRLAYTENGAARQALFFSTGTDYPGSGRFSGGVFSIAVFEKNGADWALQHFDPLVGVQGAFNRAEAPQSLLQQSGAPVLFVLKGGLANGPGAEINYTSLMLYSHKNNQFARVLNDPFADAYLQNGPIYWKTQVKPTDAGLLCITRGTFGEAPDAELEQFWQTEIPWWKGMRAFQQQRGRKKVEIRRLYGWQDGQLLLQKTNFK
jgi:hypothetical protein